MTEDEKDFNPLMNAVPENLIFRIFQDLEGKSVIQIEGFEDVEQAKDWAKGIGIGLEMSKKMFGSLKY